MGGDLEESTAGPWWRQTPVLVLSSLLAGAVLAIGAFAGLSSEDDLPFCCGDGRSSASLSDAEPWKPSEEIKRCIRLFNDEEGGAGAYVAQYGHTNGWVRVQTYEGRSFDNTFGIKSSDANAVRVRPGDCLIAAAQPYTYMTSYSEGRWVGLGFSSFNPDLNHYASPHLSKVNAESRFMGFQDGDPVQLYPFPEGTALKTPLQTDIAEQLVTRLIYADKGTADLESMVIQRSERDSTWVRALGFIEGTTPWAAWIKGFRILSLRIGQTPAPNGTPCDIAYAFSDAGC